MAYAEKAVLTVYFFISPLLFKHLRLLFQDCVSVFVYVSVCVDP